MTSGSLKRRTHLFADFSATHPPNGVPVVSLESININLDFSRGHCRSQTLALNEPAKRPQHVFPALDEIFSDLISSQPVSRDQAIYFDDVSLESPRISQPADPADVEMLDDLSSMISDSLGLSQAKGADSNIEHGQGDRIIAKASDNNDAEKSHKITDLDIQHFLELADAALRTLICANPSRIAPGVRLLTDSTGPKLAEISPTLFSQGYLDVRRRPRKDAPPPP